MSTFFVVPGARRWSFPKSRPPLSFSMVKIGDLFPLREYSVYSGNSFKLGDNSTNQTRSGLSELSGTLFFREEVDDRPIRVTYINYEKGISVVTQIYQPEKDTGRLDWKIELPSGKYLVLFQIDGCQPVSHGPYVI